MKKHYDASTTEKEIQAQWLVTKPYICNLSSEKPLYSIDTPPPTVNGKLHIGHIFSYTQADMIARYKRMNGFNVFYPFGFDDNGLPTERLVETEIGKTAKDLPRSEFNRLCLETTMKYESEFEALFKSLGFSSDWSQTYKTISTESIKISQRSFIDLYDKGKIYTKEAPVLWCTHCRTSIAQAELESLEKDTLFYTLKFGDGTHMIPIATTRPELLNACVAIFVHPEDARYKHYIGKNIEIPLYSFEVPILTDTKVDMEKGTGAVMCCTFGDVTDMEWVKHYNLPIKAILNDEGVFLESIPYVGGLTVPKARKSIVEALDHAHYILEEKPHAQQVGVHERCGKPIEIRNSKQWYIEILSGKERFINAAHAINWYPASMKNRYLDWVENLKWDWCISRQRYFGIPIPVWHCKHCAAIYVAKEEDLPAQPLEQTPNINCTCGSGEWLPETSILDTWATSSLTPQLNSKWGEENDRSDKLFPMTMRTQAHEIIRTWAFYTIVKSLYHFDTLPWRDIMVCGFVLAKKGEKISKSKSNAIQSPKQLIEEHSADAVRYWAASAKLGTDTFFDLDDLAPSKRWMNKLWNASKFAFLQLGPFTPKEAPEIIHPIDRWILERLQETCQLSAVELDKYEVGAARHLMDRFFYDDFCDDYLEIVKDRLYKPEVHGEMATESARFALYHTLLGLLKLYAIYAPHLTEHLYAHYFMSHHTEKSIHIQQWNPARPIDSDLLSYGTCIKKSIMDARRYKSENALSMKAPLPSISIKGPVQYETWFRETFQDLQACCHTETILLEVQ